MLSFVMLVIGFVLLVWGADKFVEGASALVVSSEARASLHDIVERSSYIELSTSAVFNELYIEQMEFE